MPIYVYLDGCERSLVETPEEALHLLPPLRGHLGSRLRRRCGRPLQEEKPESDDEGDQARSHRCHCALRGTILQLVLQAVCSAQRRPNVLAFYRGSRSSSDVFFCLIVDVSKYFPAVCSVHRRMCYAIGVSVRFMEVSTDDRSIERILGSSAHLFIFVPPNAQCKI